MYRPGTLTQKTHDEIMGPILQGPFPKLPETPIEELEGLSKAASAMSALDACLGDVISGLGLNHVSM